MLDDRGVTLSHGPRENRHRPSIDVLFRSAAIAYGRRATGVLLSGFFDDGTAGLSAINRRGGMAVVQDPDDAEFPDLPQNALEHGAVDICVPVSEMASRLMAIAREPVHAGDDPVPVDLAAENRAAGGEETTMEELDGLGKRVPSTCPECGGALWELEPEHPRYRCHVGHAYAPQTLASEQSVRGEAALWAALRGLEENERIAIGSRSSRPSRARPGSRGQRPGQRRACRGPAPVAAAGGRRRYDQRSGFIGQLSGVRCPLSALRRRMEAARRRSRRAPQWRRFRTRA